MSSWKIEAKSRNEIETKDGMLYLLGRSAVIDMVSPYVTWQRAVVCSDAIRNGLMRRERTGSGSCPLIYSWMKK